jgi:hypothetical protein
MPARMGHQHLQERGLICNLDPCTRSGIRGCNVDGNPTVHFRYSVPTVADILYSSSFPTLHCRSSNSCLLNDTDRNFGPCSAPPKHFGAAVGAPSTPPLIGRATISRSLCQYGTALIGTPGGSNTGARERYRPGHFRPILTSSMSILIPRENLVWASMLKPASLNQPIIIISEHMPTAQSIKSGLFIWADVLRYALLYVNQFRCAAYAPYILVVFQLESIPFLRHDFC